MKVSRLFSSLLLFLLCVPALRSQQLRVKAPSEVELGDVFTLEYSIDAKASSITLGSSDAFSVLAGPSKSSSNSYSMVNGKVSSKASTSFSYSLRALREGSHALPAATAQVDGHAVSAPTTTVSVRSSGATSAAPAAPNVQAPQTTKSDGDLFIRVFPSRTRLYEQEALLLDYKVYCRTNISLPSISLDQKPDFQGMISKEIPTSAVQTTVQEIDGHAYNVGSVVQYVVFPLKSGTLTIPSIAFTCTIQRHSDPFDIFDYLLSGKIPSSSTQQVRRTTQPTTLQVLPLPVPQPTNFSGAVGRFNVSGELLSATPATGDIATYRLSLRGTGNHALLTPPAINFPASFETFSPQTTDNTSYDGRGFNGEITYDYSFTPNEVGTFAIPAFSFVYFNPETGAYETATTSAISLDVKQGANTDDEDDEEADEAPSAKKTSYLIKTIPLLLLLLPCGLGFYLWKKRRGSKAPDAQQKRQQTAALARTRLTAAEQQLNASAAAPFFDNLEQALTLAIGARTSLSPQQIDEQQLPAQLQSSGLSADAAANVVSTLHDVQQARYSPLAQTTEERMQLLQRTRNALQILIGK